MIPGKTLSASLATQPIYIEDVFSTYLYTGNNTGANQAQTITNGINLAGEGGLVWLKKRGGGVGGSSDHALQTYTGGNPLLQSNNTNAGQSGPIYSFNNSGFTLWLGSSQSWNQSTIPYTSWTFRKAKKFFDVVSYTGNGASSRAINHNLSSTPGCIIIKCTSTSGTNWIVWHRQFTSGQNTELNTTGGTYANAYFSPLPTSTQFTLSSVGSGGFVDYTNASGREYVAYLFAHDAGGFGDDGNQNVISCGSFTMNGTNAYTNINLGWEPQWVMTKLVGTAGDASGPWEIWDNMRGWPFWDSGTGPISAPALNPNNTADENNNYVVGSTPTGLIYRNISSSTYGRYIYIAIRRGPMKTPTTGTSVFSPVAYSGNNGTQTITAGFPVDAMFVQNRNKNFTYQNWAVDRLRAVNKQLYTDLTDAEGSDGTYKGFDNNIGLTFNASGNLNGSGANYISWFFRRAPGFFDVVCYTGTGVNRTVTHNLGVAPELMIVKRRNNATEHWNVYNSASGATKYMRLNQTLAASTASVYWNDTAPTSSVFTVGTDGGVNASGGTYVAYLFASVAGVSKVGSYTGTGTTLQVNCGFTGGARFVLIKRTDSTGDWYVWDSARGIVAGNDPYLVMNGTQPIAEVTNTDYVDTYSAGFEISSTAPAAINANGGTYIFLAVS